MENCSGRVYVQSLILWVKFGEIAIIILTSLRILKTQAVVGNKGTRIAIPEKVPDDNDMEKARFRILQELFEWVINCLPKLLLFCLKEH